METNVEVLNYKVFLQELVRRFSYGYYLYGLTYYPEKKKDKWLKIDEKLLQKYSIFTLSKYQRARRKRAGLINGRILRYKKWMVIQVTLGQDDVQIIKEENLVDIRKKTLILKNLYGTLSFRIGIKEKGFTVYLEKECWRDLKAYWHEKAAKATPIELIQEWKKFDQACPSWTGITSQKISLRKEVIERLKKRGIKNLNLDISPLKSLKVWN